VLDDVLHAALAEQLQADSRGARDFSSEVAPFPSPCPPFCFFLEPRRGGRGDVSGSWLVALFLVLALLLVLAFLLVLVVVLVLGFFSPLVCQFYLP
jgi:hypothetical protein